MRIKKHWIILGLLACIIMIALTGCKADILNRQILSQVKGTYLDLLNYVAFTIDEDGNMFRISRWGGYDYLKLRFDEMYVYYEDTNEKVLYSLAPKQWIELDGFNFNYISSKPIIPYSPGPTSSSLVGRTWVSRSSSRTEYRFYGDGTGTRTNSYGGSRPCTWESSGFGEVTVTSNEGLTKEYCWYLLYGDEYWFECDGGIVG